MVLRAILVLLLVASSALAQTRAVDSTNNQTGLGGNKTWTGNHTHSGTVTTNSTFTANGTNTLAGPTTISGAATLSGDVTCTDCIALETETSGNYVEDILSGNAIDVTDTGGEGATPTISVDSSESSFLTVGTLASCDAGTIGAMLRGSAGPPFVAPNFCTSGGAPVRYFALGDSTGTPYAQTITHGGLGAANNGVLMYCSDCTKATPCGSGGTGAFAKRIAGAWDCD